MRNWKTYDPLADALSQVESMLDRAKETYGKIELEAVSDGEVAIDVARLSGRVDAIGDVLRILIGCNRTRTELIEMEAKSRGLPLPLVGRSMPTTETTDERTT